MVPSTLTGNAQNPTLKSPGNWKNKIPSQIITLLAKHECWPNRYNFKLWGMTTIQKHLRCWAAHKSRDPWQTLDKNRFGPVQVQGRTYHVVVDYYSKYFEISKLLNNTLPIVINHMKTMLARHGILKLVFSDKGPEFASLEFRKFSPNFLNMTTVAQNLHNQMAWLDN